MRQFRTYGSVRGVIGNYHPYRDPERRSAAGMKGGFRPPSWSARHSI